MSNTIPLSFLLSQEYTKLNYILVIANSQDVKLVSKFESLWENATFTVCADGGANRLYDHYTKTNMEIVPKVIVGDFDSVRPEVLDFYSQCGSECIQIDDQDSTDLDKACGILVDRDLGDLVVVIGGSGGNTSQYLGNIQTAFKFKQLKIVFMTPHDMVLLVPAGVWKVEGAVGNKCGLLPIGGEVERIRTAGLKWELGGEGMEKLKFGGLVSTSNRMMGSSFELDTSSSVLVTMDDLDL
eukprot:TRINITY_DN7679_c0_g1_i1.p1 TRINITY_DN7679_c0_g1~~TRINITY_DN7679_c0_g1_i1.p1  ORF type:complete len:250 (+),score=60.94 TRINITY_DN7679_c0_g1_i1:31-750(+)